MGFSVCNHTNFGLSSVDAEVTMSKQLKPVVHEFESVLDRMAQGLGQHYFEIPSGVAAAIESTGSRRVVMEVKGLTYRRALNTIKTVGRVVLVGKDVLREAKMEYGDVVQVKLWADPEPDRLDIPEEFQAVMDTDPEAAARFEEMTLGMKRSLLIYITQAKHTDTRIKRSLEMAEKLRTKTLYGDRTKK
jgi:hypothetical protein